MELRGRRGEPNTEWYGCMAIVGILAFWLASLAGATCHCKAICQTRAHCGMSRCAMEHGHRLEAVRLAVAAMGVSKSVPPPECNPCPWIE